MQNLSLPVRSTPSRRNQESRSYFTSYTPPSSTEAINGPVREPVREQPPMTDRLIVGVDFGTTFSGWVDGVLFVAICFGRMMKMRWIIVLTSSQCRCGIYINAG